MMQFLPAINVVRRASPVKPAVALVLGSGLGGLAEKIQDRHVIPYKDIPDFPSAKIAGHAGNLVFGTLEGVQVVAMQGRCHYYEGHPMTKVVFGIRLMKLLGARVLITSNAVGAINKKFRVGDLMLIRDHLNLLGDHPLRGPNLDSLGPRFYDMTRAYDANLRAAAKHAAKLLKMPVREGVYAACMGPSYETPAEINMLRMLGADAVGMSTVPEVLAARHMGMSCLSISFISNMAAGVTKHSLSHEEVMEAAAAAGEGFERLVMGVMRENAITRTEPESPKSVKPKPARKPS